MTNCPRCSRQQTLSTPSDQARLEYCPACGTAWLAFGKRRPPVYDRLEAEITRWEADLAHRQARCG